jgi:hypothetical protein
MSQPGAYPPPRYPYPPYLGPERGYPGPPRAETQRDVEAALAARRELGPEYEDQVAAGLADRVEQLVAYRTAELRHADIARRDAVEAEKSGRTQRFVLGIVSLGCGIPITAISATNVDPGLLGVIVSWAGIVGVNAVHALATRPRRPD